MWLRGGRSFSRDPTHASCVAHCEVLPKSRTLFRKGSDAQGPAPPATYSVHWVKNEARHRHVFLLVSLIFSPNDRVCCFMSSLVFRTSSAVF